MLRQPIAIAISLLIVKLPCIRVFEALMTMKGRAEEATVLRAARRVGLDVDRLRADMEKRAILDQIYETMDLADTMMLTGTPTFIAGHEASFGKLNLADLKQHGMDDRTPLWFYILREADVFQDGERLGPVGARIVAETVRVPSFSQ